MTTEDATANANDKTATGAALLTPQPEEATTPQNGETPPAEPPAPEPVAPPEPLSADVLAKVIAAMKLRTMERWLAAERLYAKQDGIKAGAQPGTLNDAGMDAYYTLVALATESNLRRQVQELTQEPGEELVSAINRDFQDKSKRKIIGSAGQLTPERICKKIAEVREALFTIFKGWTEIHKQPVWKDADPALATEAFTLHLSEKDPAKFAALCVSVATLVNTGIQMDLALSDLDPAVTAAEAALRKITKGKDADAVIGELKAKAEAAAAAVTAAQPAEGTAADPKKMAPLNAAKDLADKALAAAETAKKALDTAKSRQENLPKQWASSIEFFNIFGPVAAKVLEARIKVKGYYVGPHIQGTMTKLGLAERWALLGEKAKEVARAAEAKAAATSKPEAAPTAATPAGIVVVATKPGVTDIALMLVGKGWAWGKSGRSSK